MLDAVTVLLDHMDELVGVFDEYQGSHFCAGLRFGYSGSNLLFTVAETLVKHAVNQMKKRK